MAPGDAALSSELPVRTVLVHETVRTRVSRLYLPKRTIIRKQPVGSSANLRLRHERLILSRLRGATGIAQLLPDQPDSQALLMADAGSGSLADLSAPLRIDEVIRLGALVAGAVAGMHRRGVMHRDISPGNILLSDDGVPCLVDFMLSSSVAEIRPPFTHHGAIVGTLAYLAPEQTGRTGRAADERADLYAFGATMYHLATGGPPFDTDDPLRLTADHLTRIPVPPTEVNPAVPPVLSDIILRLLEKEPDDRYQSADGLLYDLQRVAAARIGTPAEPLDLGERDAPLRPMPPSRLVERDVAVATLTDAFEQARAGRCRGVLVSGSAGVGKTALANQLRQVATGSGGWFVAGKFDQFRNDLTFDAIRQALSALGRLLLAEADDVLADISATLTSLLGPNAGLLTAAVPEFETLLSVSPDPGDPVTAQVRAQHTAVAVLQAVASPQRPLVVFLDDVQWAGNTALGAINVLFRTKPIDGLLLVCAYRDDDAESSTHPPTKLQEWQHRSDIAHVQLKNLPLSGRVTMVAEMLRVPRAEATELVEEINPYTSGNPQEMVELVKTLCREGVLTSTTGAWRWDKPAVRAHLAGLQTTDQLAVRMMTVPEPSRILIEQMACLGGRVEMSLLTAATGDPHEVIDDRLTRLLSERLLVVEPAADPALRFSHDQIRERVLTQLDPGRRRILQLTMARRLALVPSQAAAAAQQYLLVIDDIETPSERQQAAALLRRAADEAALIGDYELVDTLLGAALRLLAQTDVSTLASVRTAKHVALFAMGRLEAADDEYRAIVQLDVPSVEKADATAVQVRCLSHRNLFSEALRLGLDMLQQLGIAIPAPKEIEQNLEQRYEYLPRWLAFTDQYDDLVRPEINDPLLIAASRVINAVQVASNFVPDPGLSSWLGLETVRMWLDHGPGPTLVGPASTAAHNAVVLNIDESIGFRTLQQMVRLGDARGYEPDTSQARYRLAMVSWWHEPLEQSLFTARRAREGLIAGGALTSAGFTYATTMRYLMDCGATLGDLQVEAETGLAFARRNGNVQVCDVLENALWFVSVLRGEDGTTRAHAIPQDGYVGSPLGLFASHNIRATAAAIFGDVDALTHHSAEVLPTLDKISGNYAVACTLLLRALALAGELRTRPEEQREERLSELDQLTGHLANRATDAPGNFVHLLRLIEAERAWALGDYYAAVRNFDAARHAAAQVQRPWHRAVISERAGSFLLAHGMEHTGFESLAEARREYLAWGAMAKVAQLDWAYPSLHAYADRSAALDVAAPAGAPAGRATVTSGMIDLLGVLSASQALSSETSIERLQTRVTDVLSGLTGATGIELVLWNEDRHEWVLAAADSPATGQPAPLLPTSVLRYAQRSGEPLVVADALRDGRFAHDPYFIGVPSCSLLTVPIVTQGSLRALLLLENRLMRGAFTADRLDAVKLIAAQLAVSLDNAQLYAELTASRARIVTAADSARRRIQRDLHDGAQQHLVSLLLRLHSARITVPEASAQLAHELDDIIQGLTGAVDELREIARGIHPAALAEGGLTPALRTLARRSAVPVRLDIRTTGRLPDAVELAAYYIVAEALTNVAKHAHATSTDVSVEDDNGCLLVRIQDDGLGGADPAAGTGLMGLRDRVEALGGHLIVQSPRGKGTTLRISIPLTRPRPLVNPATP